ncbi:hypothetical protein HCN44_009546 [Aphidius gifuensis]|uniref:Serum response factor-binding protein 1 n=1 Tax=Aphidius gifuensis TaxID=684658 RepID=A0A835CY55_APHGI|nr:hypothetical protein HCN44_009546 [Aphidius gifuensis]
MGNKNERKIAVNKEIVLMRQAVRKTRLGIIWKLTKESQRLKSRQHGDEKVIKKCKRKGGNLIKELRVLKKIKDDEISKYAITNDKSLTEVLSDPKAKLKTRILTRMAFHKILKTRIEEFKKKFPDYLEFMGPGQKKDKVLIEKEETLITKKTDEKESKKANNLLSKKVKIQEKNKTKKPVSSKTVNSSDKNIKRKPEIPINRERVVKRFKLEEEQDEIAIDTAPIDPIDSDDPIEEDTVLLTDDPFFHPGGLKNKDNRNESSDNDTNKDDNNYQRNNFNRRDSKHGNLNRRSRRALMNNTNNNDTKNSYFNRQDKRSSNDNYDRKYNNKFTKQNDDKFNSIDSKNKFNDKINKPTVEKDLHPSWAAKKKQQVIITQGFQGNKIIFDD